MRRRARRRNTLLPQWRCDRALLLRIPAPVYRLIAGGIARLHLTGQKVLPARNLERGFEYRYAELRPALEEVVGGQDAGRASG